MLELGNSKNLLRKLSDSKKASLINCMKYYIYMNISALARLTFRLTANKTLQRQQDANSTPRFLEKIED